MGFDLGSSLSYYVRTELAGQDFGPYSVVEIPNFHIALKDGCKIATKVREKLLQIAELTKSVLFFQFWFPLSNSSESGKKVEELFQGADHVIYCVEVKEGDRDEVKAAQ